MRRRAFLKTCVVTSGAGFIVHLNGCSPLEALDPRGDALLAPLAIEHLPIPALEKGSRVDGVRIFDLKLQKGQLQWMAEAATETFGINRDFLGPTLVFEKGETVLLRIHNNIGETTTLHWHGLHVPAVSNGGPHASIANEETWETSFEVKNYAMTAWYHPLQMERTARQVAMGLSGFVFVKDKVTPAGLPENYGVDDLPLIVQDRQFAADGRHPYSNGNEPSRQQLAAGVKGNTILVNGARTPDHIYTSTLLRLRLLNASNARIYNIGFNDNYPFQHIATDGGLLEHPITQIRVLLAPGERAEIVVDMRTLTTDLIMKSYSNEVQHLHSPTHEATEAIASETHGDSLDQSTFLIMTFKLGKVVTTDNEEGATEAPTSLKTEVTSAETTSSEVATPGDATSIDAALISEEDPASTEILDQETPTVATVPEENDVYKSPIPENLNILPDLFEDDAETVRHISISMTDQGIFINDQQQEGSNKIAERLSFNVELKVPEVWEIKNTSSIAHPIHIHNVQFFILDIAGKLPGTNIAGLKDTVLVPPHQTVRIVLKCKDYTDNKTPYFFHSNILEHMDAGMIGQFYVI